MLSLSPMLRARRQILCVRSYEIAAAKMPTKIDQARAVALMNTTFQVSAPHARVALELLPL
jgi:hypothetical protein